MFDGLSEKLNNAFKRLRSKGKLTPDDVKVGMREIKMALLEADVNYKVVRDFIKTVSERAVGVEVLESLLPGQQVVKIVHEEMIALMGGSQSKLTIASKPPTVIMMVGLQGAGKTTHAAKLANMYKKQGKNPMMVACDVYRPAAIRQLEVLGEQLSIPVFSMGTGVSPVKIAREGLKEAIRRGCDMVFIDTAGRLHIDEELMEELKKIKAEVEPTEILLTIDAMIGQDSVNVAESFNELLDITGVILTKLDGDTRGGAALSVRHVTGKPIKFIGVGEKMDAIEPFHPDRMASRILGMGDVLTLIDKAQEAFDEQEAEKIAKKARTAELTLEDFLEQMQSMKKMGGIKSMLSMLPGMSGKDIDVDENAMKKPEAIIRSMTPRERRNPSVLNASRRKRIAAGSGTTVQDVNQLIRQFDQSKQMMKQMMSRGRKGKFGRMRMPF